MDNYLVITFGTREVQFEAARCSGLGFRISDKMLSHPELKDVELQVSHNDNYPGWYYFRYPRIAGKAMLDHPDIFIPLIRFPLIENVFEMVGESCNVKKLVIVYTDQEDLDLSIRQHEYNSNRDTVHYASLFRRYIETSHPHLAGEALLDIGITQKATDIDFQYNQFHDTLIPHMGESENIDTIHLFPQGGIDQVNHALTLQLIQAYGNKVILWQHAEGAEPHQLQFPFLFIRDLERQKIIKHLEDYDFGLIAAMGILGGCISELADYAHRKLNLDYSQQPACAQAFIEADNPETRIRDLYLNAKIHFRKGDYGNYLWRIFTILESIYRYKCEIVLGDTEKYSRSNSNNDEWIAILRRYDGLTDFLRSRRLGNKSLNFERPSRHVYKHIYNFLINKSYLHDPPDIQNYLNRAYKISHSMARARNDIAHYLRPINREIINEALRNTDVNELNTLFDNIFELEGEADFGIFDKIRNEIGEMVKTSYS